MFLKSLLLHVFLFLGIYVNAQGLEIDVLKAPDVFTPGEPHVVLFNVTNVTSESIKTKFKLDLPEGWAVVTKPFTSSVPANKTIRLIYSLSLDSRVAHGSDTVTLAVQNDGIELARKSLIVKVEEVHALKISIQEKPDFVKGEEDFYCVYKVVNNGNIDEKFEINARKGYITGDSVMNLPVDSTVYITINQKAPKIQYRPQNLVNNITLQLLTYDTLFYKSTSLLAYPNAGGGGSKYRSNYLLEGGLSYNFFNIERSQLQVVMYQLKGDGYINLEKKRSISFQIRGTNLPHTPRFETQNRYSLSYSDRYSNLSFGDFSLTLSRLLEGARIGRGVQYSLKTKKLRVKSFYNQLLFLPEVKDQYGGSITFGGKKNDGFNLKLNAIRRNHVDPADNSQAASIEASFENEELQVEGEFAMSQQGNTIGNATYAKAAYKNDRFFFNSNFIYARAGFQGFYNDGLAMAGGTSYSLSKAFQASVGTAYNFITPRVDTVLTRVAPFSQNHYTSLKYKPSVSMSHKILAGYRSNMDRSDLQKFNYTESYLSYNYAFKQKVFSLSFDNTVSKTINLNAGEERQEGTSFQSRFGMNGRLFNTLRVGGSVDFSNTNRYSTSSQNLLFYGLNISYLFKQTLNFSLGYRNNVPFEEQYRAQSLFSTDISYSINSNHSIIFTGTSGNPFYAQDENDYFFNIKYSMKLNVPTHKNRNLGDAVGVIKTDDGQVCAGVILSLNGMVSITNDRGEFEFKNIPSGDYYMTVEASSIEGGLIPSEPMPKEVYIFAKKTTEINLTLVKPCRIKGVVNYERAKQMQSDKFKNSLPNIVIKLTSDSLKQYTLLDSQGKFQFNQLKPGEYTVAIVTKGMERKFEFPVEKATTPLKDGETVAIELKIKDKVRKMNFSKKKIKLKSKD